MKKLFTYYSLGLLTAFGLIATGVQAFDISNVSIIRDNMESRTRFEVVCERVGDRLDLSYVCDGRPKPPTPTPASCGNGIVENWEECDGSAPEGYVCSNQCLLVEEGSEAICGNGLLEEGEQCDGSAPEGYVCSNRCELIDENDLSMGEVVINEVYYDTNSTHGVEPSNEWLELYNTGTTTVDLINWSLTDSEGISMYIRNNFVLEPGEFAILTSEASTVNLYWQHQIPEGTKFIIFGTHMGNGLDNDGDSLTLSNPDGIVDRVSWGNDNSVFYFASVPAGYSMSRVANGYDTNTASDWLQLNQPTPGS